MNPGEHALRLAGEGLAVFPCGTRAGAKLPMVAGWPTDASMDSRRIGEWWARWPNAGVGVGHMASATLALDIDAKPGKANGWETLITHRVAGQDDPQTAAFTTSSGGGQRLYLRPAGFEDLTGNYAGALGPGLDLILGYSLLPSGPATPGREWTNDPSTVLPAPAPEWVMDALRRRLDKARALAMLPPAAARPLPQPASREDLASMRYVAAAVDGEVAAIRALPQGQRQMGLAAAAANVGRALARQSRGDLADWAVTVLASATVWTAAAHEQATIRRQVQWGLGHG